MRFTLTIDCDNAAFSPESGPNAARPELLLCLEQAASKLALMPLDGKGVSRTGVAIRDTNGNQCGTITITDTED